MGTIKCFAAGIPFLLFHFGSIDPTQIGTATDSILKYGELGLCLVLVVYLMWSNYSLTRSLTDMVQLKTAQEERLIQAINEFCNRPCQLEVMQLINKRTK